MIATLTYAVLYVSSLEKSRDFFSNLGLDLREEQHNGSPIHYSAQLGDVVLELYPANDRPVTRTRLGLRIPGAETTGALRDPDGNVVDIEPLPAPETAPAPDTGHGEAVSETAPVEHLTLRGMAALCEFWPADRPVAIRHCDGSASRVVYASHETAEVDGETVTVLALADHWPYGADDDA